MLKAVLKETKLDPKLVEDIVVGNVLLPGSGALLFRGASIMADIPVDVPIVTVNRFCSSGLEAVSMIASKIRSGLIEIGIGAGCECMSQSDMADSVNPELLSETFINNPKSSNCLLPMGVCSEILSKKFN